MTSMILIIILLTKIFAFIIKQSFFVNKNHIITRRQERSPAGILAGLVRVQPQLLRKDDLVVYQVANRCISDKDHLQPLPRRCYEHKENPRPVFIREFGVSSSPDLTRIALNVIKVYHAESVQAAMLLQSPAARHRLLLASLLVLNLLYRLLKGADEDSQGQPLLLGIVGLLVATSQRLTGLLHLFNSFRRRNERPKLFQSYYFSWQTEASLITKHLSILLVRL